MKESIYLRAFEPDDYRLINKWRNDPVIQKLVGTGYRYISSEMEKAWVQEKMMNNTKEIYLAVCLNDESREMVGYVSVNEIDYINRSAFGGGIVIGNRQYQNGEIRHEVGVKIRELVFDHLNLNRFSGACLAEHKASQIMMEACGYRLEGIKRQAIYKNGLYHDLLLFSLLREEYYLLLQEGQYTLAAFAKRVRAIKEKMKKDKIDEKC